MGTHVTIYDIARSAGVGIATVSRVLNGSPAVRPATRLAVQKAMAELGYRPSRAARRLATSGPNRPRIAVLLPFFTGAFYFAVTRALARRLAEADVDLVIYDIESRADKHRVFDRLLDERGCEALVLVSCCVGPERQERLARLALPAVVIDRRVDGLPCAWVDNARAGAQAVAHVLARGARWPAFIGAPPGATAVAERLAAFEAAAGCAAPRVLVPAIEKEGGRVAAAEILDEHPDTDALVCANDILAVGALEELRRRGLSVPERVQVIGFDDQPLVDVIGLTTLRQPMSALGTWAAKAVVQLLTDPGSTVASQEFPVDLIQRTSTRSLVDAAVGRGVRA